MRTVLPDSMRRVASSSFSPGVIRARTRKCRTALHTEGQHHRESGDINGRVGSLIPADVHVGDVHRRGSYCAMVVFYVVTVYVTCQVTATRQAAVMHKSSLLSPSYSISHKQFASFSVKILRFAGTNRQSTHVLRSQKGPFPPTGTKNWD